MQLGFHATCLLFVAKRATTFGFSNAIGVAPTFKLILAMYTKEASEQENQTIPLVYPVVAVLAILLNIIIGIWHSLVTNLLS